MFPGLDVNGFIFSTWLADSHHRWFINIFTSFLIRGPNNITLLPAAIEVFKRQNFFSKMIWTVVLCAILAKNWRYFWPFGLFQGVIRGPNFQKYGRFCYRTSKFLYWKWLNFCDLSTDSQKYPTFWTKIVQKELSKWPASSLVWSDNL